MILLIYHISRILGFWSIMGPNFVILNDSCYSFQCTFHERKQGKIDLYILRRMKIKPIMKKRRKINLRAKMHCCMLQNSIRSTYTSYKGLLLDLSRRVFRGIEGIASTVYYFKYNTKIINGDNISTQFSRMIEMEFRESQHIIHHRIIWSTQIIFDLLFFQVYQGKYFHKKNRISNSDAFS